MSNAEDAGGAHSHFVRLVVPISEFGMKLNYKVL